MKTEVFLREEQVSKEISITDPAKPEISEEFSNKWQGILDIIADIIGVSAALIMKINPDSMEVLLKSQNQDNPYKVGGSDSLGNGLYCETVIARNEELYIKNALKNVCWNDNPDIELDMISYYGLPINWPDKETFGTICVLDDSPIEIKNNHKKIIQKYKNIIEEDLRTLISQQELNNFFEVNLDLLCIANTEGEFVKVNKAWEDLLGYSIIELEGKKFLDFIHPEDLDSTQDAINKLRNNKKVSNFVNRFKDKKGNYHFIEWNSKANGNYIYAAARDITEKIMQSEKINQQKKRLDWIISGTNAGTWEWNVQTGETVFNDRWAEMLGYSLEELSPISIKTWEKLTHPEDFKKAGMNLEKHFKGETKLYDVEIRMKHKDGHWVWINDRGRVISWTKNNKPLKMFGIHIDITDRKEKEQKLNESKALLENLTDQVPGTIYQYQLFPDGSSCFPYASRGIYDVYGVTPGEVKEDAEKAFQRIHPEDYQQVVDSINQSAEKLTTWHDRHRVNLPDQGLKWLEGNATPEKLSDGSVLWHGNIRDITVEKERERQIEESEKRYRTIFNFAPNAIFIIDQNGNYLDVNIKSTELLGYKKEEFLNLNIRDVIAESSLEKGLEASQGLFAEGYMNTEVKLSTKDNEEIDVIIDAVHLSEDLYLGFAKDITRRKERQAELEFQYQFQKTLAEISSNMLNINKANIDRKFKMTLKKIGEFFNIDRSYIFQFEKDNTVMSNIHEWCNVGIESEKEKLQNISVEYFPWWMKKLYNNQVINIEDVDKMSKKAEAEQKILKDQNIKSVVVMPIFIDNKLFGFFGFDSVKNKKTFEKEEIRLLNIFTDVITNAFSKYIDDKKIRDLTYIDSLTGLYNRRFFEEELARLDTKRQLPLSIIVTDINGLKIVNDSLGHKKGDQLLVKSAEILKNVIREEDILARLGGDEFVLLLPQIDKNEAEKIISRIKEKLSQTKDDQLPVSMALGTAVKTDPNQDIEEVLRAADNNMYQNKLSESRSTKNRIVQGLLNTLEIKSNETREHAMRMTKLAFEFGRELGLTNFELNRLSLLSTLHDIGKITISENILKQSEKLTAQEWEIIKEHPERGYKIANSSEEFALVAEEIYAHHEKWDGSGYPRQLSGEDIPYLARIISIIDAYDVMIYGRPYKKSVSKNEALQEIKDCAGSQFDPELANRFIEIMK